MGAWLRLIVTLILLLSAHARDIYVTPNNNTPCEGTCGLKESCPCVGMQAALAVGQKAPGQSVNFILLPGIYGGAENFNLTFTYSCTVQGDPDQVTVFSGAEYSSKSPIFSLAPGIHVTIVDISMTKVTSSSPLISFSNSSLSLRSCNFFSNQAQILQAAASPQLEIYTCYFVDNEWSNYLISASQTTADIRDTVFRGNNASLYYSLDYTGFTMKDVTATANNGSSAFDLTTANGSVLNPVSITNCTFNENLALSALVGITGATVSVQQCTWEGNILFDQPALLLVDGPVSGQDLTFNENMGNYTVDMAVVNSVSLYNATLQGVTHQDTRSAPNEYGAPVALNFTNVNLNLENIIFDSCFRVSRGRVLNLLPPTLPSNTVMIKNISMVNCGNIANTAVSLMSIKSDLNGTVTLEQARFISCSTDPHQQVVFAAGLSDSIVTLRDIVFRDCSNSLGLKGAVLDGLVIERGPEIMSGTAITCCGGSNLIQNSTISGFKTTPLKAQYATVTLKRSRFADSNVTGGPGVMCVQNSNVTTIDCSFEHNSTPGNGGVFYATDSSTVLVIRSNFTMNYAHQGGALFATSGTRLLIYEGYFTGNNAVYGGSVYVTDESHTKTFSSYFSHNTAFQSGGAVYIQSKPIDVGITLPVGTDDNLLENSTFSSNECVFGEGGAISLALLASPTIANCTILDNTAISGGGISVGDASKANITNTTISHNRASSSAGGVMIRGVSSPLLTDCVIERNIANSTAGGILIQDLSSPILHRCHIKFNLSPNEGGGLSLTDKSNTTLHNCTIDNNSSGGGGGGASFSITARTKFISCQISNNIALSSGGGIAIRNECQPTFNDTIFQNNTASEGGALSTEDTASPSLVSCTFSNNTARSHGGCITASDMSHANFSQCVFVHNNASKGRGGVAKMDDEGSLLFEYCNFTNNRASTGGVMYVTSAKGPTIMHSYFHENIARTEGGVVLFAGNSTGRIVNCSLHNNKAGTNGGTFLIQDSSHPYLVNLTMENNHVFAGSGGLGQGGAIYAVGVAHPVIVDCIFRNNSAFYGGGFSLDSTVNAQVDRCIFVNNWATRGGGAYFRGFRTSMRSIQFDSNQAAEQGGGMVLEARMHSANASICANCTFMRNRCAGHGGGLYMLQRDLSTELPTTFDDIDIDIVVDGDDSFNLTQSAPFAFENAIFHSNRAHRGGALFSHGGLSWINFGPVQFYNNTAFEYGGALWLNHYNGDIVGHSNATGPSMHNGTFFNNDAEFAGTNVAWNFLRDTNAAGDFCTNCNFTVPANYSGYQTDDGFATPPITLDFISQCPATQTIEYSSFNITLRLVDCFGTSVNGTIEVVNNLTVTVSIHSGQCSLSAPEMEATLQPNGEVQFNDLQLRGDDNSNCELYFEMPYQPHNIVLNPSHCNITLKGCPPGMEVQSASSTGGEYDTCEQGGSSGNASPLLWSGYIVLILAAVALGLCCLIVCVGSIVSFKTLRRRYYRYVLRSMMVPDLERKPLVTLEGILHDPEIPHILWEEIVILDRIGMGANGIVSRGMWTPKAKESKQNKVEIALKELFVEETELANPVVIEEFLIEIKFLSKLNHANVVKFLGISSPVGTGKLYLITELMHFGSLRDVLDRNKHLPWPLRLKLAKDAAKGMAYLHSRKVIHRDLKPQNLLVNESWTCKIADFGISTVKEAQTRTMTCIGTPTYMAPEVLAKAKYSEKADVYSFGVLLCEIYTTRVPYTSGDYAELNQAQLMYKICNENARPHVDEIPVALRELILDCWNMEPKLRPSFSEIVIRLRRLKGIKPNNARESMDENTNPELKGLAKTGPVPLSLRDGVPNRSNPDGVEEIINNLRGSSSGNLRHSMEIPLRELDIPFSPPGSIQ